MTDALSPRAMFEFLAHFLCSGTMYDYKLIVIYLKKIEIECEAGCVDKTTHHSLLVLLDCVEACNKEDKDRVVAEAAAQFESWKLEVARTISTTKMETKGTVLTRVSVHPIKARFVTKFIAQQEEIAGLGNGGQARRRRTPTPPLTSSNWHSLSLTN